MAALYGAGVRGSTLTAITAWKEVLLAVALVSVGLRGARAPVACRSPGVVDWLAIAFAAFCVVYALIPQSALGGAAGHRAVALGLRHDVVPVGAYFLGRALPLTRERAGARSRGRCSAPPPRSRRGGSSTRTRSRSRGGGRTASSRTSTSHLGYDYHGTGGSRRRVYGLPENFIYNVGGDKPFLRRLVSTFLSPLASGYLFVVALLVASTARVASPSLCRVVVFAGLLWTFSRSSLVALAVGLVVLACVRRGSRLLGAAVLLIVVAVVWVHLFPHFGADGQLDAGRPQVPAAARLARPAAVVHGGLARTNRRCTSTGRR